MTLSVSTATVRLQREMRDAEATVDQTISQIAALMNTAAQARADVTEVAPEIGQAALMRLHKTLGSAITLRADVLRTHGELKQIAVETGVGDHPHCPDHVMGSVSQEGENDRKSA